MYNVLSKLYKSKGSVEINMVSPFVVNVRVHIFIIYCYIWKKKYFRQLLENCFYQIYSDLLSMIVMTRTMIVWENENADQYQLFILNLFESLSSFKCIN